MSIKAGVSREEYRSGGLDFNVRYRHQVEESRGSTDMQEMNIFAGLFLDLSKSSDEKFLSASPSRRVERKCDSD